MRSIKWEIPCSILEEEIRYRYLLEDDVKITGCEFDELGDSMVVTLSFDVDGSRPIPEYIEFGTFLGEAS